MREELEYMYISNAKQDDKLIITGLTNKSPMPLAGEAKKKV